MRKTIILCFVLFCCCLFKVSAQGVKSIIAAIDSFHKRQPLEKLYLQTDKPYYAIGDTMRFKAYLLDESLSASLKSRIMYVELINDSSRVCKRQMIMLSKGMTWGDIVIKKTWYPGNYIVRAYTNWMRNFGEEHFFTKPISITPANNKQWLVTDRITIDKDKNVDVSLHFSGFDHKSIGSRDIALNILSETKILLQSDTKTDAQGNIAIKFKIPEKLDNKPLTILVEDITNADSRSKTTIPIQFNQPEDVDLQFMPEGGGLIGGIKTKIGFKAIGEDGRGTDVSGKIYDSKQQEVAVFKSTHLGMGIFELSPQPGESYTAKIDGNTKSYTLPVVSASGIALTVNTKDNDSLDVVLSLKSEVKSPASAKDYGLKTSDLNNYYLIGQARDKVCYGAKIDFKDGAVNKNVAKSIFPTGIVKFVLFDGNNQPVSQRMVFVDHDDLLNISMNTSKENYSRRDSVGLRLTVTDKAGNPVQGHFSLAVTDDGQVKAPGVDADNIASDLLLNPDLKGAIEQPGYYFNKEHPDREAVLDNLLLTQGWAGYDWKPVFEPPVLPKYEAETQITVKGRVSDLFGLSISHTEIMLISTHPQVLLSTKTDKHGRFTFTDFPFLDTISFHIQPTRRFNVGVDVDEFVPPTVPPLKIHDMPWYIDSDSTLMKYVNNKQAEQDELFNSGATRLLKTVTISDTKVEPLHPLLKLSEEDIRVARTGEKPLNLFQLLERYIKNSLSIQLTVDGASVNGGPPYYVSNQLYWLYQYHTEDIKSFSVEKKRTRGGTYIMVINIISNAGRGGPPSGIWGYGYRPMPVSWPHQFYSPRYAIKDLNTKTKDRRSTIFWAPDIATDANGKAEVSFYSADAQGSYALTLEGGDMNGNVGYYSQKIKIVSTMSTAK